VHDRPANQYLDPPDGLSGASAPAARSVDTSPAEVATDRPDAPLDEAANGSVIPEPDPLGRRFFNLRTLASFAVGLVILGFVIGRSSEGVLENLTRANPLYYLAALALYYLTFPIRALRWRKLLRNVGFLPAEGVKLPSLVGITEIILLSWFANCIVPAKLGDAYRAYLLKRNSRVSFSKTFGTILAERIIDTLLLSVLLALSTTLAFGSALPGEIQTILLFGLALAAIVLIGLFSMRNFSRLITPLVPKRYRKHYVLFEAGTLGAFGVGRLPMIMLYSLMAWSIEAGRVYLVCLALGIPSIDWPIIVFVALAAALLTTVPFTPAGLGLVEAGIVGTLVLAANLNLVSGIDESLAKSVAILDRTISYLSIVAVGAVVLLVSKRR